MRAKTLVWTVALLVFPALTQSTEPTTSKSFSFATYKEQVDPITILVGTFQASLSDSEDYFPLQIAVGARGKDANLTITRESFQLIDPDGNVYSMASYKEVVSRGLLLETNANLNHALPLVTGEQFANSNRLRSDFFPTVAVGIVIDRVHIKRTTYMKDLIYFPRPEFGLHGVHTLRFRTAEMTRPIDVRFKIPLKIHGVKGR